MPRGTNDVLWLSLVMCQRLILVGVGRCGLPCTGMTSRLKSSTAHSIVGVAYC